jgi:molybdate transport system permease protein
MGGLSVTGLLFLLLPLAALSLQAPWARFGEIILRREVIAALRTSLAASLASLGLALLLGIPLAWLLARREFPGKPVLRALATLPMVLPPVVGGVALLLAYGRRGLAGQPLADLTGATIPFTFPAVVMAGTFVAMPFLVVTVEAALRAVDTRYEDAAATLGARRTYIVRRVTLPMIGPSLGAGLALTWARALGEFGATITFAGNLPGRTQTLPLAVYLQLETSPEAAYLLSVVLLAVSVLLLGAVVRART